MNESIDLIEIKFKEVTDKIKNIKKAFLLLNDKITTIKTQYIDLINEYKEKLCYFGLDSFRFQYKIIELQYNNMQNIYNFLNNRLYCDFYKLYKFITNYIHSNISNEPKISKKIEENKSITIYDDLLPFKNYCIEDINNIYTSLIEIIKLLITHYNNKQNINNNHQLLSRQGYHINNFVTGCIYTNGILQQQILLYLKYLSFFNHIHLKHLNKLFIQCNEILNDINKEISFDGDVLHESHDEVNDIIDETFLNNVNGNDKDINDEIDNNIIIEINSKNEDNLNEYDNKKKRGRPKKKA